MDGITALDIAQRLGISSGAAKMRLNRRGIKPFKYIGPTGLYTEADLRAIKDAYQGNHMPKPAKKKKAAKPKKD